MAKTQLQNGTTTETINGNLVVTRQAVLDKNGKQLLTKGERPYYNYIVKGIVRGEERTIRLVPRDNGGYEPLDIMFGISEKAELVISDVTSEINGVKSTRTVYEAQVADEDGELWKCELKPEFNSSKTLLNFLLISLRKQRAVEHKTAETAETA